MLRVHRALGPGLLESAYQACLARELRCRGIEVGCEVEDVPLIKDGIKRMANGYEGIRRLSCALCVFAVNLFVHADRVEQLRFQSVEFGLNRVSHSRTVASGPVTRRPQGVNGYQGFDLGCMNVWNAPGTTDAMEPRPDFALFFFSVVGRVLRSNPRCLVKSACLFFAKSRLFSVGKSRTNCDRVSMPFAGTQGPLHVFGKDGLGDWHREIDPRSDVVRRIGNPSYGSFATASRLAAIRSATPGLPVAVRAKRTNPS